MTQLPGDIYQQILLLLPQQSVLHCRLLNKSIGGIATALAFRHVRLEASRDVSAFLNITRNEGLRGLVREITVDTWVGPEFAYHCNDDYEEPLDLVLALPYLRLFRNLLKLNLRFSAYCGNEDGQGWGGISFEETYDFRFAVLHAVFSCIAGTWTEAHQDRWLEKHSNSDTADDNASGEGSQKEALSSNISGAEMFPITPIPITSLTVSNLAGYDDKRLASSDAFKTVMSLPSLRDLKLLVAVEQIDASPESATWLPEKYDFFESLPQTWLSRPTAQNLRVLSLYCADYWGWNPKMDFRAVNALAGSHSGFPNLKVLALGNYVLSHEWQVDWIASLGQHNGRGGLEELYLDGCPIMWQARNYGPFDESTTTLGIDVDGKTVEISNEGYNIKSTMNGYTRVGLSNPITREYGLRWSKVLQAWRDSMKGLKVFKMGSGHWWGPVPDADEDDEPGRNQTPDERERNYHRLNYNVFLNYDSPSPPLREDPGISVTRTGASGLKQDRQYVLQYIQFNSGMGPSPWLEKDFGYRMTRDEDDGLHGYESSKEQDENALKALLSVVAGRRVASIS